MCVACELFAEKRSQSQRIIISLSEKADKIYILKNTLCTHMMCPKKKKNISPRLSCKKNVLKII